ncbi:MAG: class I SAM-dependent methyltransferase [Isosphaeraceae bacterium]
MSSTLTDAAIPTLGELAWCIACKTPLSGRASCPSCDRPYPSHDDILEACDPPRGRNRIVAAFYDGPGWARFRKWERMFLTLQGGARRARISILRHLTALGRPGARVLEVGIGDGENLRFLPDSWSVHGVDISRAQLFACARRDPRMKGRLALAEAECLPFPDGTFDACFSIGGFTYYADHAAALREMRRVTRDDGPVVVADETPGMHRAGIGHLLGRPAIDRFWLGLLGLDRDFIDMVFEYNVDLPALTRNVWPEATRLPIWNRLGYCLVHPPLRPS